MFDVKDNLLSENAFNDLKTKMTSNVFPWFYQEGRVDENDGLPALTHSFYNNNQVKSNFYDILSNIIEAYKMKTIIRIKANFDYKNTKSFRTNIHTDLADPAEGFKTGIFYLNDNDGKTYFENGNLVDSVANRFVKFSQSLKHGTQTHTDTNYRIVINFNWYE
jgi:hypothetical protein